MDFTGKKILVTGASRGIGLATARAFLDCGATVAVNGRTAESVDKALAELGAERTVAAPGDLVDKAGCDAVVGAALHGLGGLDVLVNNAGVFSHTP
ncbi:MAG: SDR family NAD(P)-dependent oxidoreductase, partial [Alphaproteobacteria bacterium]